MANNVLTLGISLIIWIGHWSLIRSIRAIDIRSILIRTFQRLSVLPASSAFTSASSARSAFSPFSSKADSAGSPASPPAGEAARMPISLYRPRLAAFFRDGFSSSRAWLQAHAALPCRWPEKADRENADGRQVRISPEFHVRNLGRDSVCDVLGRIFDHSTTSTFSPPSSRITDWMRVPRWPMQEPMGVNGVVVGRNRDFSAAAGFAGDGF